MNALAKTIQSHILKGERISLVLSSAGPKILEELLESETLRGISRISGLSPTYLSMVKNEKVVISPGAYLILSRLKK